MVLLNKVLFGRASVPAEEVSALAPPLEQLFFFPPACYTCIVEKAFSKMTFPIEKYR